MKKVIRLCSTEKEIIEIMSKWHPNVEDYQLYGNNGADYILVVEGANEEEQDELDLSFGEILYGDGYKSLSQTLVEELLEKGLTIATAESLTGGNIGAKIVEVPGCSNVYYGGIVSYSNEAKSKYLGVAEDTILSYGAVSEQTAIEMATGLLSEEVQIGISTTGIAGPSGGSLQKPVGLVYIATTDEENTDVYREIFKGDREQIRNQARDKALFYALKHLHKYY